MIRQRGAAMVEFALIGLIFFTLLFGIIEVGRAFFTYNTLQEAIRRGARVAAVCPVSTAGISYVKQVTIFRTPDSSDTPLLGLTPANIRISYLDSDMAIVATDTDSSSWPATNYDDKYDDIAFVQVSIDQNDNALQHTLFIPVVGSTFNVIPMTTVLPSESLGRISNVNPVETRCCPGNNYATDACTNTPYVSP
jgi:Flp pilus assembly protein TadG